MARRRKLALGSVWSVQLALLCTVVAPAVTAEASPGLDAIACVTIDESTCPALRIALQQPAITTAELAAWLDHAPADPDRVRKAASVLSIIGGDVARAHLVAAAKRFGDDVSFAVDLHAAAARLGALWSRDALLMMARGGDVRVRVVALSTLSALSEPGSVELARSAIAAEEPRLAAVAAQILGKSPDARDGDTLLEVVSRDGVALQLRRAALLALAARGDKRVALVACQLVSHPSPSLANAALTALAAAPQPWATPAIAWALEVDDLVVAASDAAVTDADRRLGDVALRRLADKTLPMAHFNALLKVVVTIKPTDGARTLLEQTENADEAHRVAVLKATAELGDHAVVPRLVESLVSARGRVANFTVHALEVLTGQRLGGEVAVWRAWLSGGSQPSPPSSP